MAENIFKRGKIWWCRFTVGGKEQRTSLRTSDRQIALKRAKEARERAQAVHHFGDARTAYVAGFVAWAAHLGTHVGRDTEKRYLTSFRQIDKPMLPLFVDEIDSVVVRTIIRDRRAAGVTNSTLRRDLTALSQFLDFCISEGWRDEDKGNPALNAQKRIRERRDPIVLPTDEDIALVLDRCPPGLAALARASWLTGCRQDELVTAERKRLDHKRHQLTVIGKGNKLRVVALWRPGAYECLRKIVPFVGSKWLFHHDGEPYRNVSSRFRSMVRDVQASAQKHGTDFRPFRFHDLRHRYAVDALKSGRSIYDVQKDLGHSSVKVTEIYLDYLTPDEVQSARNAAPTTAV